MHTRWLYNTTCICCVFANNNNTVAVSNDAVHLFGLYACSVYAVTAWCVI